MINHGNWLFRESNIVNIVNIVILSLLVLEKNLEKIILKKFNPFKDIVLHLKLYWFLYNANICLI